MKRLILSAAAVAFAGSAYAADTFGMQPAQSYNPFSGHIEGYIGGVRISAEGESESGLTFGGASRLNYNVNSNWNVQGDLLFDQVSFDIEDFDFKLSSYGAAGHVYWRDPNSFALGGFVTWDGYDTNVPFFPFDTSRYTVGAEGQLYFDRFTLYGQAYFGAVQIDVPMGGSASLDLWGVRGVGRYFVTDNFRIDGELGYQDVDLSELTADGVDQTSVVAALQANYRFTGTPVTVFGRYQYENFSIGNSVEELDFDTHKLVVGLRVTFNRDTLLQEDRTGATMDTGRSNVPFASPLLGFGF